MQLDFGTGVFSGNARGLDIAVRTNGRGAYTSLVPRQPLTPTPFAIQAGNASSAASVSGRVSASSLTGTIGLSQLPSVVVTNGATGVNITGTFSGNAARVTNVELTTINSYGMIFGSFEHEHHLCLLRSP